MLVVQKIIGFLCILSGVLLAAGTYSRNLHRNQIAAVHTSTPSPSSIEPSTRPKTARKSITEPKVQSTPIPSAHSIQPSPSTRPHVKTRPIATPEPTVAPPPKRNEEKFNGNLVSVRFYPGPNGQNAEKRYTATFSLQDQKRVCWEAKFIIPNPYDFDAQHLFELQWTTPSGRVQPLRRNEIRIAAHQKNIIMSDCIRILPILRGDYTIHLIINSQIMASGVFSMKE
jgi:hypothetical protein